MLVDQQMKLPLSIGGDNNSSVYAELVTNIHHEFRTPLTMIQGATSVIRQRPTPEVIDVYSDHIMEAVERLLQIGNYMATISKLSIPREHTAAVVTSHTVEQICAELARDQTRIKHKIQHPFNVPVNRDDFEVLLCKLVSNALCFSEDTSPVVVEGRVWDGCAEISVVDCGIGIAAADLEKVFLPFYKVDSSRYRSDAADAGLGLSVAQATGSTFTIRLPLS